MSKTLLLLRGGITLESALEKDDNMLQEIGYPEKRLEFYLYLLKHRYEIEVIVSYHLGLSRKEKCRLGEVKEWISGSFNVCILVYIDNWVKHSQTVTYSVSLAI